jgi:hypothetical protein
MTSREIRARKKSERALAFQIPLSQTNDDQVYTFTEWCRLNRISESTGRRIIHSSDGPEFVNLTPTRYGVTVRANREWQMRRACRTVA